MQSHESPSNAAKFVGRKRVLRRESACKLNRVGTLL